MSNPRVLGIVLAGGEGKRLMPLTADRAKPAVPFGGSYRLIDFVLSNLVNAGFARIAVLTQYKSHSLDRHVTQTWAMPAILGDYVTAVPAQQRLGPRWYTGSADAIYQSMNLIEDEDPDYLLVFGADNIYRMDPRQMLEQHIDTGAAVTVAGIRKPRSEASEFGVIEQAADSTKIEAFHEKPADPPAVPGSPDESFISMGNYIFTREWLVETLRADAADDASVHDMGGNIIPALTAQGLAHVYDFGTNEIPGQTDRDRGYWKDVGSIDAYHEAHMDLVSVHPIFNLYNRQWPIITSSLGLAPAGEVRRGRQRPRVDHRRRVGHRRRACPLLGAVPGRARPAGRLRRGCGPDARRADRAWGGRAQHDPGQERGRPRRRPGRRAPRRRPRALHGLRGGHRRRGQGHHDLGTAIGPLLRLSLLAQADGPGVGPRDGGQVWLGDPVGAGGHFFLKALQRSCRWAAASSRAFFRDRRPGPLHPHSQRAWVKLPFSTRCKGLSPLPSFPIADHLR